MLKVGLTGSIGTGKSSVNKLFKELGAYTLDADKIVHDLLKREDIKKEIEKHFGNVFDENGNIDRKKLASIVFNNKEKKKILENIIHPKVREEINNQIKNIEKIDKDFIVIVEVPLLIETGSYKDYDIVIVVYAPFEKQLERLLSKGFSKEEALKRINSQMSIEEKLKYADIVINNSSDFENLKKEVIKAFKQLKELNHERQKKF
jgi:dephospho-CoA kinase